MRRSLLISGVLVVVLAQLGTVASCQTSPVDETGVPTGGLGGSSGGSAGAGGSGGSSNESDCNGTLGMGGECGVCDVPLDDYCADHECVNPDVGIGLCRTSFPRRYIGFGCGYVTVSEAPDGTNRPLATDVWEEATGQLVYRIEPQQSDEAACAPVLVVGDKPDCDTSDGFCDTGYSCPFFPHLECLSNCVNGCLPREFRTCQEWYDASGCGQGGEGGIGGAIP